MYSRLELIRFTLEEDYKEYMYNEIATPYPHELSPQIDLKNQLQI